MTVPLWVLFLAVVAGGFVGGVISVLLLVVYGSSFVSGTISQAEEEREAEEREIARRHVAMGREAEAMYQRLARRVDDELERGKR